MANSGEVWRYQERPARSLAPRLSIDGSVTVVEPRAGVSTSVTP